MFLLLIIFFIEGLLFFILQQMSDTFSSNLGLISTIIVIINTVIFIYVIAKYSNNKNEYMIFIFAYFIRIIFLYWDIYARGIFTLPNSGADTEMFHSWGVQFAQGAGSGRGGIYSEIIGIFYMMFGEQRILVQYFNVLLSIYTMIIVNGIMRRISIVRNIRFILLILIAFLPNFVIMSSILLRETLIIFLLTLSLYFFLNWWEKRSIYSFITALILPIVASLFHSGAIAVALGFGLCFIFYNHYNNKYRLDIKTVSLGLIFAILFIGLESVYGDSLFGKFQGVENISDVSSTASSYSAGNSAYSIGGEADSIPKIILYTPVRVLYFITSPMPWDWRGLNDIFAFVFSGLFYLSAYIFSFRALKIKNTPYRNLLIALVVVAMSSALIFAWGVSNSGSALRHREKFLGIYLLMIAISLNGLYLKNKLKLFRP